MKIASRWIKMGKMEFGRERTVLIESSKNSYYRVITGRQHKIDNNGLELDF
jgi:hypothetical protein